jgi:Mg2+ and Co2+ transporter CorA
MSSDNENVTICVLQTDIGEVHDPAQFESTDPLKEDHDADQAKRKRVWNLLDTMLDIVDSFSDEADGEVNELLSKLGDIRDVIEENQKKHRRRYPKKILVIQSPPQQ